MDTLLHVENLNVALASNGHRLLHDVGFTLPRHACLGIVGESGSGKSLTCRALMGLLGGAFTHTGHAWMNGVDIMALGAEAQRRLRGATLGMILQHPMSAFDPLQSIGGQMVETLLAHRKIDKGNARELALDMMRRIRLRDADTLFGQYPCQVSGGMLQRVMIAIALALEPRLLIADEPTTALDAITRHEVMREFHAIRERLGTTMIFISHDFGVVNHIADRMMVMHQGEVVEHGDARQILRQPRHRRTRDLIASRQALQQRYHLFVPPADSAASQTDNSLQEAQRVHPA